MADSTPARPVADRNLLFGILALQMDFISRDALIQAMHAWVLDKAKPLGQILVEQEALRVANRELLEALVQRHLELHDNDPEKSLASVSSIGSVRQELRQVADPDLHASLALVSAARPGDPERTVDEVKPTDLRYRILRPHARGGLGEVFVALDQEVHREVALKEIQERHAHDPISRGRFLLEAEITGGLEHPGIVPVYGLGQYGDGRPFYAMRFIKGDNLKEAVRRFHEADVPGRDPGERSLAFRQLLGRFVDVCHAVAYAHSRAVLHRDLKPGNIMLGKYGETLIIDWGLAKPMDQSESPRTPEETTLRPSSGSAQVATQMGAALGTPAYMSPEQAAGRLDLLSPASDIYSLGATLYTLLTGQAPFREQDAGDILQKVQRGEVVWPREVKPGTPAALDAICRQAMALQPENRYPTALALAADVEHWLADEPVSAYPEPWTVRGRRWMRRHQVLVAGAAVLLIAAVAGLGIGTVLLSAANRRTAEQRDRAEANLDKAKEAVDQCFTVASENPLLEGDAMQPVRELLHRAALKYYQDFIAQRKMDPSLRTELARNYHRMGYISDEIGLKQEAVAHYEQARALWEELVQAHPGLPEYLFGLARTHSHMGSAHQEWARWDDGRAALAKAIPILERLLQDHPRDPQYPSELARVYHQLGTFYRAAQKLDQAEAVHRKALELRERLTRDHPGDFRFTLNLATSYGELGNLKRDNDQPAEALDWYARNIRTLEALLQTEPRYTAARQFLINTYEARAALFLRGGRQADAVRGWRRVVELSEGQSHPAVRVQRAAALAHLGEHTRAVAEIELMLARGQEPEFALYNFACVCSLASAAAAGDEHLEPAEREKLAGQYAARAIALLIKARDAGFFKEEGLVGYLEKDSDFAPLRPRADFQKLLQGLKEKK